MARVRALFFGTPAIAVPSLVALADVCDVVAVVCQPDRPAGRELSVRAPATKVAAEGLGIPVHQPVKVRTDEFARWVAERGADLAVVLAYGRILTPAVLAGPRLGCVNLHASLLPAYRGAAPINWAIVRGEAETGVSLMQMDEGLDTGPVYVRRRLAIGRDETAGELTVRMGELAAAVVRDEVPRLLRGELVAEPQDHARATHAPPLGREHGLIDWSKPATELHDLARGLRPWPGAHAVLKGKSFKLLATARTDEAPAGAAPPGTVYVVGKKRALVACGEGWLEILRGQLEGRKALEAADLIAGRTLASGDRFGLACRRRARAGGGAAAALPGCVGATARPTLLVRGGKAASPATTPAPSGPRGAAGLGGGAGGPRWSSGDTPCAVRGRASERPRGGGGRVRGARVGRPSREVDRARRGPRAPTCATNWAMAGRTDAMIEEICGEFPRFGIVYKRNSLFSKVIDVALRVVTLGGQSQYMTRFHTVIGNTLYVPDSWDRMNDVDRVITLRHERVHLRQSRRYTAAGMAFLYLVPFLPLGLAYGRARIEWEAYAETVRAIAELKGLESAEDPALREHIIAQFVGPSYGWMWPFRAQLDRWYDELLAELRGRPAGGRP